MVRPLSLAIPFFFLGLVPEASAQVIRYEFSGSVSDVGMGIPDSWSNVVVGDPISMVFRADARAGFVLNSPTRASFDDCLVSLSIQVGGASSSQAVTGRITVTDNQPAGSSCFDGYAWIATGTGAGFGSFSSVSLGLGSFGDPVLCQDFVEGFVLPGTFGGPVDPDDNFANFALFTQGSYFIDGTVTLSSVSYEYEGVCLGDGGDQMGCTDCPCMNSSTPGSSGGCLNTEGRSAELEVSGLPSVGADSLRMEMRGGASNTFAILSSASSLAPANAANPCFGSSSGITSPFFDGLRCVVQGVLRHGTRSTDANGDIGVTTNGFGPPSGPAAGLLASNGFVPGQTRHFQIVYRDDPLLGCGTGQNTTQAVTVVMLP